MNPNPGQSSQSAQTLRHPAVWLIALAMAGLPCLPLAGQGQPEPSVGELREQMLQLQAEREVREPLEGLVQLKTLMTNENLEEAHGRAAIQLQRELTTYNMVWAFEPIGMADETEAIIAPMCRNGSQWITLEPGLWRLSLVFGRPGQLEAIGLPPCEIRVVRDRVYGIEIGKAAETALLDIERQAARETEFQAQERDKIDRSRQPGKP